MHWLTVVLIVVVVVAALAIRVQRVRELEGNTTLYLSVFAVVMVITVVVAQLA